MSPEDRAATETRKTVTVVFCDLAGSTELGEQLDPETLRRVMSRFYEEMSHTVERHGGTAAKFIGDAVMAVFGIPALHEDDALRAVRAATEIGPALERLNDELEGRWGVRLQVRVGVNTGEVVVGNPSPGQSLAVEEVVGDAVNVAARLERAAATGEVLIGADTHRLVRNAIEAEQVRPLELKGKAQPVPAWRLLSVAAHPDGGVEQPSPSFVGRERELGALREALRSALDERGRRRVTLIGPAGIGKSRLVSELVSGLDDGFMVLSGRCLSYGEGNTFWPLAEVVRQAAGIGEGESAQAVGSKLARLLEAEQDATEVVRGLTSAIGASEGDSDRDEIFWAVRRLLEALASDRAVVLVFEDVHWAEPTLLDMIDYLGAGDGAPILILCTARPELVEHRPSWGRGSESAGLLGVEPLDDAGSRRLIAELFGTTRLPEGVAARISEAADGNPLFLEEMFAMLADEGVLQRIDRRWKLVGDLSQVMIPRTVQALLAARLDSLSPENRMVLERASVVGLEFWPGALAELLPGEMVAGLDAQLAELRRRTLVRPGGVPFAGEQALRFTHLLVRDATYEQMLKETRAQLHERFASWVEAKAGPRVREYEEIIGYHLERAHRYLDELGPLDEHGRTLGRRAAGRLSNAGRRALARGDMAAAVNLLERAMTLVPKRDPERSDLEFKLSIALAEQGETGRADALLSDLIAKARRGHAYLSYKDGNDRAHVFELERERPSVRIGRNPANDVALEWDAEVSRSHASIVDVEGRWVLVDDNRSHNGSFVNGTRVTDRHPLEDGDILCFGKTHILYRVPPPSGLQPMLPGGPRATTATAVGVPGAVFLSDVQQRVLVTLCDLVDSDDSFTPSEAADERIARELSLSVEAVRENLWALSHVLDTGEVPEEQRVTKIVEQARRTGLHVPPPESQGA
jgi:class 3 adenylate cyclase